MALFLHLGRGINHKDLKAPKDAHRVCPRAWSDIQVAAHLKNIGQPTHYAWPSDKYEPDHENTILRPLTSTSLEDIDAALDEVALRRIDVAKQTQPSSEATKPEAATASK